MVYDFIHIPGIERRMIHDSNFITGHLHDCVWIVDTKIFLFFRSISI